MNIQGLIDYCNVLKESKNRIINCIDVDGIIDKIKQLDEPEKVKVPPFVAVWYEINKDNLDKNIAYLCLNNWGEFINDKTLFNWMSNTDNFIQILINMHQFGYEVEKEKKFFVKIKCLSEEYKYLNYFKSCREWLFSEKEETKEYRTAHTRKELEEAGFSEVFNSPLFETVEVE